MKQLILKYTFEFKEVEILLSRYINLFNKYYEKRINEAYFEIISQGFLYIIPSLDIYKEISQSIPNADQIKKIFAENKIERDNLLKELINIFKIPKNAKIQFQVEVFNYPMEEVYPIMKKIFHNINFQIKFSKKKKKKFLINFPNLEIFADYLFLFIYQIRLSQK